MNKVISIIVPIYLVEQELSRCIESIVTQSYPYLEVILVNDGSPDNCYSVCKKYAAQDSRIILINKENGGLSDARNAGLKKATGDYVMYVDSDDYIEQTACEQLVLGMIREDVDFVVGALKEIRAEKVTYQRHTTIEPKNVYDAKKFIIYSIKANEWYAPAVLNLYRRDFLIRNSLYFRVGQYYEDMDMLPRLYMSAQKIVYIDFDFYNYVVREASIMTSATTPQKAGDAIGNYIRWKDSFDQIEDKELQRYLYGVLLKCFLKSCRDHHVTKWMIYGFNLNFAMKYALNNKERIKLLMFSVLPNAYVRME